MTDTRIQIIEMIEHYMDKTLSDGCLIWTWITRDIIWKIIWFEHNHYSNQWKVVNLLDTRHNTIVQWQIKHHRHIYWHYDITAVLKYIESKWYSIHTEQLNWCIYIYKADWFDEPYKWILLFKPLYLYTEKENKDLLELLKKIWQTNK